jgi:hypothetical protein
MQHQQTESESVPNLQKGVLRVQMLDSGEYYSENEVSLQYYKKGCEFVPTGQFTNSHGEDSPHRQFRCPFSVVVTKTSCWRGHISDIWGHDLCEHTALAQAGGSRFVLTVDCAEPGLFHRALDSNDETFFLVCRVINMDLYCCFLYVGPEARASSYNYCMTIESTDGSAYATVCLPAKSYFVDIQTLFRNRECAVFSYVLWN